MNAGDALDKLVDAVIAARRAGVTPEEIRDEVALALHILARESVS